MSPGPSMLKLTHEWTAGAAPPSAANTLVSLPFKVLSAMNTALDPFSNRIDAGTVGFGLRWNLSTLTHKRTARVKLREGSKPARPDAFQGLECNVHRPGDIPNRCGLEGHTVHVAAVDILASAGSGPVHVAHVPTFGRRTVHRTRRPAASRWPVQERPFAQLVLSRSK
jgi:hypothetical protein